QTNRDERLANSRRGCWSLWLCRLLATEEAFKERDRALRLGRRRLCAHTLDSRRDWLLRPFLRDLDHTAIGLDRSHHPAVDAVNVSPRLQFSRIVDEGGLIGQINRDDRRKMDVLLVAPKHPPDALLSVPFFRQHQRQQDFGIFRRVLHAHAAVAVSSLVM